MFNQSTIRRATQKATATIANGAALSGPVEFGDYAGGTMVTPATLNATTTIAFKVSADGTNFFDLRDGTNAIVQMTVDLAGAHAYPLPDELFGFQSFKVWANAAGVDVNQTGAKVFNFFLKG